MDDLAVGSGQARPSPRRRRRACRSDRLGRSPADEVGRDAVELARGRARFDRPCAGSSRLNRLTRSLPPRRRRAEGRFLLPATPSSARSRREEPHADRRQRPPRWPRCSSGARRAVADLAGPPRRVRLAAAVRGRGGDAAEPARGGLLGARRGRARPRRAAAHRVGVEAGAGYVVGAAPTVLRRVAEYSDTLEIYPDLALMRRRRRGRRASRGFELEPTLGPARTAVLPARPGAARGRAPAAARGGGAGRALRHRGEQPRAPAGAAGAGAAVPAAAARRRRGSTPRTLARVAEAVEARLAETVTLADLAAVAGLSPFHFARSFKAATGLAPHQYVLARRIELAKRLAARPRALPVQEIAWERRLREPQPLPPPVRGAGRRAARRAAPRRPPRALDRPPPAP